LRTPEEFRSLAAALLPRPAGEIGDAQMQITEDEPRPKSEISDADAELARDVRLFHARITEAVECAVERLLCDVACDVLARELHLAPANVERIVDRALERYFAEQPLRVRVHPDDAESLHCALPVLGDPQLSRGDAIVELRDGFVDASLGIRLDTLLREFQS
jgi:flagellar biosynthesis/type III secretory pathway protein FliH